MELSKEWYHTELVNSEYDMLHRSPTVEYSFYNAVKTGDMETVIRNCKEDAFIDLKGTGVLSRNPLTNIKYHFVVTTAMITRYCIDGGLEPEQAYRLSDFYILKMDSCTSIRQVADLHHEMVKDFTGKWFFRKKVQFSQSLSCSVSTTSTRTSKNALPSIFWLNIPGCPRVICPVFLNKTLVYPSVTISVKKRLRKRHICCAIPISRSLILQIISPFPHRAILSRFLKTIPD